MLEVKELDERIKEGVAINQWLVADFIKYSERPTLIVGAPGCGKGMLALQLAECVAKGLKWLGRETTKMPTMYISYEDTDDDVVTRSNSRANKLNPNHKTGHCYTAYVGDEVNNFTVMSNGQLKAGEFYSELGEAVLRNGIKLLIIDHLSRVYAGDENCRTQVNQFSALLTQFCSKYKCMVIQLAHTNKTGVEYSGSSANVGSYRQVYTIYYNRAKNQRQITCTKSNISSDRQTIEYIQDADCFCHCDDVDSIIKEYMEDGAVHTMKEIVTHCKLTLTNKAVGMLLKNIGCSQKVRRNANSTEVIYWLDKNNQ